MFSSSKTVVATYNPPKNKSASAGLEFNIIGRATSVLTCGTYTRQGDHVTAYRLVEEGLYIRLDNLSNSEVDELHHLKYRNVMRERRSELYDYVSAIAILDLDRKSKLYAAIDNCLAKYNKTRNKKTDIKKKTDALHRNLGLFGEPYNEALQNQEAKFKENGERLRVLFQEITSLLLTFYNKIPHTAYHEIEGFQEKAGEIKVAKTKINTILEWITQQGNNPISSATLAAKRPAIVEVMNSLIHYPEITDAEKLAQHVADNITYQGKNNKPRNNDKATLVLLLARHIHIFFAVYPLLENTFNQKNELIDEFVEKFIGSGTEEPNWPSYKNNDDLEYIKRKVKKIIASFKNKLIENHYSQWKEAESSAKQLDSSEDEDISTRPIKKAQIKIEDLIEEVTQLRKIQEIVMQNRTAIPKKVMEEIDNILACTPESTLSGSSTSTGKRR